MSARGKARPALVVLAAMACSPTIAQEVGGAPYQPLFTEKMIGSAAPEQRERMRAAEKTNRQTFERRQRERDKAQAPPADATASAPPPRARTRRSKIYRWVDDKGRVHFGDAPAGKGAEEIKIRGSTASPTSGTASPPPGASPAPPDGGRSDSRNQRRGS